MSNTPDIIGKVRDLKYRMENRPQSAYGNHLARYNHDAVIEKDIAEHFPRIVEALLIAVETLKKVRSELDYEDCGSVENVLRMKQRCANEALSLIRSL